MCVFDTILPVRKKVFDKWFYSSVPPIGKFLQVYVKGDGIVVVPLLLILLITGFISLKLMMIAFLVFFSIRQLGEMVYWIARQLASPTYRPYDFGFSNLNTKAVYILYQLFAIAGATIGVTAIIYILYFYSA